MTTTELTGRKKRADERVRSDVVLATLADRVAAAMTPWLLAGDPAPKGAHDELRKLGTQLLKEARLEAEAIDVEFGSLVKVAEESLAGARRFADGAGRHGRPQ